MTKYEPPDDERPVVMNTSELIKHLKENAGEYITAWHIRPNSKKRKLRGREHEFSYDKSKEVFCDRFGFPAGIHEELFWDHFELAYETYFGTTYWLVDPLTTVEWKPEE